MFEPWNHQIGKSIWKTKSQYFVWLRGVLRKNWSDNPLRKSWKVKQLRPVTKKERLQKDFHPSTKNVGQCYLCKKYFPGSKLECDHIEESGGCYDFESASQFLWHCVASDPDNWALVCKPCHKIKSHSCRYGMTFKEAMADKKAIQICKDGGILWLKDRGILPASNAKKRRQQIFTFLLNES